MKTKRLSRWCSSICLLLALLASGRGQEEYNQERYQLIIDRLPFGKEVLAPLPSRGNNPEAERTVLQDLRLSLLSRSETGDEIFAGFQNLRARAGEPKSITMMVGESFRSYKLLAIDLDQSSATLEYQNNNITMNLTAPAQPVANQRRLPATRNTRGNNTDNLRRQPQAAEPELSAEEQAARLDEIRARLMEQQRNVPRGQPPIPVPGD